MNQDVQLIEMTDDDLWRFLGFKPRSLADISRRMFPWSPQSWMNDNIPRHPCEAWINWAKAEILSHAWLPKLQKSNWRNDLRYLCRLLRILEQVHCHGVREEIASNALASGLVLGGEDAVNGQIDNRIRQAMNLSKTRGLTRFEEIDEWKPGMASGSGWRTYISLTVAGICLADGNSGGPPAMTKENARDPMKNIEPVAEPINRWRKIPVIKVEETAIRPSTIPPDHVDQTNQAAKSEKLLAQGNPTWLTVTESAELLMKDIPGLELEHARARVSVAAKRGYFKTNGEKGKKRRISCDSFSTWRLAQRDRDLDKEDSGDKYV